MALAGALESGAGSLLGSVASLGLVASLGRSLGSGVVVSEVDALLEVVLLEVALQRESAEQSQIVPEVPDLLEVLSRRWVLRAATAAVPVLQQGGEPALVQHGIELQTFEAVQKNGQTHLPKGLQWWLLLLW